MEITYLGHSSFKIKGKSGSVVTDPFDPTMVGLNYSSVEADIVTVSHDHNDHNQSDKVSGVKRVIEGPGEYEIMGISILGFPSFHDDKGGVNRGKNTIYVFEVDGIRVLHMGDLGHMLSENLIDQIGDIHVLILPVGGEYTIGAKEATQLASEIEAPFIIPMHYKVEGLNQETFSKLAPLESFLSESGLVVETLPKFQIKKEEIMEGQTAKVIVLEKK